ncbi:unnamed protein product [Medioppia subpectinata]|uniref:Uncharacterized protein n=1 Tax=Medioppia subpectinata TaxID=1979941 RepID=A0A7R9KZK0_9ACAR|nr:unnamed protein product [Medioppia subpectinata]CAG2111611.1 unnamed protein product [Medioppia subpectinata]
MSGYIRHLAIITGSSLGIGAATALLLAKSGANVVITGRNADNVSKICNECTEVSLKGLKALPVVADVTKEEDVDRLLDTTIKTFGKLDILVNNAGIGSRAPITDADYIHKLKAVFDTNLNSVIYLTHKSIQYFEKTKGNIINISSIAGIQSSGGISPYHMSKAALDMFTKCIAVDLGPKGIRVNSVNPGAIRTAIIRDSKMTEQQTQSLWDRVKSRYPVGRCGEPLDIANTVPYLASDHASFITGTIMVADGGHLAANSGGISPYHMSKAALDMFTKCIAVDLGPKGIGVNSVNPGAIRTAIIRDSKMTEQQTQSLWERVKSQYPVGRCGEPLDIANTVAYLASNHASFITGTIMVADGGHLAANVRMNFD